jgi:hypothetical protein
MKLSKRQESEIGKLLLEEAVLDERASFEKKANLRNSLLLEADPAMENRVDISLLNDDIKEISDQLAYQFGDKFHDILAVIHKKLLVELSKSMKKYGMQWISIVDLKNILDGESNESVMDAQFEFVMGLNNLVAEYGQKLAKEIVQNLSEQENVPDVDV